MATAFTNQATLSYNGKSVTSNIAQGEILEVLSITKDSTLSTYESGDRMTYVVHFINSGDTALTGITFQDNLGAYSFTPSGSTTTTTLYPLTYVDGSLLYYQNNVLQATPTVTVGDGITVTGLTIPANGDATLVYNADVNEYANQTSESTIVNTVTASGDGLTSEATDSETITANDAPNLTIYKAVSPSQVAENGQVTYTFTIQNLGNEATTGTDDVIVTDTFNPILSNIVVTYEGTTLTTSDYSYDETTGVFSTDSGVITVPAATYTQNPTTGAYSITPGEVTLTVTGTI